MHQNPSKRLAQDPVCGMTVDPKQAAGSFDYHGHTYFFCSLGCLEKFQADPNRFLQSSSATLIGTQSPQKAEYTCPMHPEVRAPKPGSCPKCGMALEPVTMTLLMSALPWVGVGSAGLRW